MKFSYKKTVSFILTLFLFVFFGISNHKLISSQERKEETTLQHQVTVTLKLVQVYVTDKKGNPAVDLNRDDFIIHDNGKRKQITEFEKHILHLPPSEIEVHPETIQETKSPASQELMGRKFFLLFDFAYNNAKGIKKAKKAALHFLDTQVKPSDEVGVLSYTTIKSLTLQEYLTRDHKEVRKLVDAFGIKDRAGRAENFEEDYWFRVTGQNPLDASKAGKITFRYGAQTEDRPVTGDTPEFEKFQAQEDGNVHALHFLQRIKDFAEALRYIPGYKHIILFSSGIPYSLMYGIHHPTETWDTRGGDPMTQQRWDFGNRLIQERYDDMLKELASSNSTVYTIDTEDLSSTVGVDSRLKGGYTLQTMASSTGGKYFGDVNNYEKHMEKIQNLTGCFYVLGYYIDEKWDGEYHKIKVKVNRPGLEVHAQKGYYNPKPFNEYTKIEKKLHLVDLALNERSLFQEPLRFPMVSLPCSFRGDSYVSLFSKLPMERIQEFSGEDVEIVSIIFDTVNSIIKMGREKKDFTKLPEGDIYYTNFTSLHPGEYKCRIVIRNSETGRGAVASSSVIVPEAKDQGINLYPPLLLRSEEGASYLKRPSAAYPFNSSQYFPLVEPLEQGTENVLAVVRCSFSGIQQPDIQLSANLIHSSDDTGSAIPASISILDRFSDADTEIFLLELQTGQLPSGEYFLYLFAVESLTHSRSGVNTAFCVGASDQ